MQITLTNCADKMPPDDHVICRNSEEAHITHGSLVNDYYDDYVVKCMQWTEYTQEKLKYLNK